MGEPAIGGAQPATAGPAISARFPATPNQQRYWRLARSGGLGAALNATFRRRIAGRISDGAITAALQGLVDRHEILRTRFAEQADGSLMQEVLATLAFKPDQIDLRHLPEASRKTELEQLGAAEARKPFDLSGPTSPAPLLRALLVRLAHDEAILQLTFHHLIMDGWSVDLLGQEFGTLAAAHDSGAPASLPEVDIQFGDYALWQKDALSGDALNASRDHWRSRLKGLPAFTVPPDREAGADDNEGMIRSILLPLELTERFEALARANNHTFASLATAIAAAALHRITGASEVVVGTQVAGRDDPDAQQIVGPLLNTVLLRLPAAPDDAFLAFAKRTREELHLAMEHQLLPFAEVENLANPKRDSLYRINLVIQRTNISSASVGGHQFGDFHFSSLPSHSAGAQWDLSMFMVGRAEGWRLSCEAARSRFDPETIDRLLAVWRKMIEGAVSSPQAKLAELARLDPADLRPLEQLAPAPQRRNLRIDALRERIVTLQPKGEGTPIIALNSASVLYPVARAIGTDHPFIDIQFCPSPVRVALPRRHFSDYARDAVEMIRLAQPHGPYVLFGLCVFGAIAIEAARQLESEGEEVSLVILNDTYRPGYREHMDGRDRFVRNWQVRWRTFHALRRRFIAGDITAAQWIDNYRIFRALRLTRLMAKLGGGTTAEPRDAMQDHNRWFPEEVLLPSLTDFEQQPYSGRVVLFRNKELREGRLFPRDFGWEGYLTNGVEVVDCPGSHDTMFRDRGAMVIGARVREILDEGSS